MFSQDPDHTLRRQRIYEIERLRHRSQWLNSKDKALVQMIFEKGSTFDQIARLTDENPSTINRRFHRLIQKLIAHELTALLASRHDVDGTDIRIVRDYFIQGLPQHAVAHKLNVSLYRVRHILSLVRSLARNNSISRNRSEGALSDKRRNLNRNRK